MDLERVLSLQQDGRESFPHPIVGESALSKAENQNDLSVTGRPPTIIVRRPDTYVASREGHLANDSVPKHLIPYNGTWHHIYTRSRSHESTHAL